MTNYLNLLGMFLVGAADSLSLQWIQRLVLATDSRNKKIHPSSIKLINTFKNTMIQVFVFLIGLPFFFRYFQFDEIALLLSTLFLLLTYGYLFFYNQQVQTSTKQLALWSFSLKKSYYSPLDHREKSEFLYSLSNQIKSFIFLILYYTPIFLMCLLLDSFIPIFGKLILLTSQAFFNSFFYFLKKWPYDRYNIAFIQQNLAYMLGYGFFVSLICNVVLTGDLARGMYFIISQWMIVNCILYSPPDVQFTNFQDILKVILKPGERAKLQNGYNVHRKKLRDSKEYRKQLINSIFLVKPALKITQAINQKLASLLQARTTPKVQQE